MEALNTYKTEKTLAEQMNERLAEMKMTKAEAALKMNYSRAALSQYLNGKYASDPTELEKKVREFLAATGGVAEGQEPENSVPTGAGTLKKKVEFFESRDFVQTIGVCQACQEYMGLGIIVGKSGQGKTHALKKYAELPRVAYIECDDTMACRDLVEAIENGIGLPKGYGGTIWSRVNLDCQHFFRQIFLGYFSDIVQAFDTLRKNVCGDDYTSLHNHIVLSSVLPAYGMFHSIQILFL